METPAAIQASYSDYRRVKGRKVLQLIFEVPLEQAPMVHDAFGEPSPDGSTWVGIAKIDLTARPEERKPLKLSNRAALLCKDEQFTAYLKQRYPLLTLNSPDDAAEFVRISCCVGSRSELDENEFAADLYRKIETEFDHWRRTA